MIKLIAVLLSIILQFVASFIAILLVKRTKYSWSWILISIGFTFMAFNKIIYLLDAINIEKSEILVIVYDSLDLIISLIMVVGVILIIELFNDLKRSDYERKRQEIKILNTIIKTEEKEKQRFAKDLHDGFGPLLSTIRLSVSTLMQREKDEHNIKIIKNLDNVINEAILSLKEISNNLSPHVLEHFGLASAIKAFINRLGGTSVKIHFATNMEGDRFARNKETVLYRVACELINNTLKHAEANNVWINLSLDNKIVILNYKDDGKGIEHINEKIGSSSGMGISNIQSRVKSVDGNFHFDSKKNEGIEVVITIKKTIKHLDGDGKN
jgi:signal transduction histidine kinase